MGLLKRVGLDIGFCPVREATSQSELGLNKDAGAVEACDNNEEAEQDVDGGNHHDGEGNDGNSEKLGDEMLDCSDCEH